MTISRLYTRGLIFPAVIVIASVGIFAAFDNRDYKSEWLTREAVTFISVLAAVFYSAIICVLGLPVFLNGKIIRKKGIASFLSWFLLPITFMIVALVNSIDLRPGSSTTHGEHLPYWILFNLPFVIGLIRTYALFLKAADKEPLASN